MAFIYEKISEEDKARVDWSQFKIWPGLGQIMHLPPTFWAVDRQRSAFLFHMIGWGRDGEHPPVDGLVWKGAFVRMEVILDAKVNDFGEVEVLYDVLTMDLPGEIEHERPQIMEAIREAADPFTRAGRTSTRWFAGDISRSIASVSVRFRGQSNVEKR
jgi:hypothetical protein